ncbi:MULTISPECIES: AEC family transporter [Brucella/Ochrobactrum group]|jgi:predicted permease|uniref:AEC family transporter n=1 Tax=Brucella pseudintermedia TaxID=370111 RepID=A0ABY5UH62_9HYPH|nr:MULTISPECIES: AEC family transporter [Brucella/Ochrobactrum group]KAB2685302.1 AEC family transporter [Brucella pseudintermedia]MCO7725622.1 AEC family transporter [Brucella intermedia]NKE76836.1 AEC family transporter [Ochrobactrum sp. MC-1LL]UWL61110.1 AEC family transporter [Brucella pseudintermedia]WPM79307.1 AEC family transporter [Brucella pseudintermedia]
MLTTLFVVLPVFALIFSGWGAFKLKILGPHAIAELNRFVVYLALPALLFDIMANTNGSELWQPGFIAVFLLSSAIAFALPFVVRLRGKLPLADTALDGLNAAYPNTGYMGIPLSMIAFGSGVLAATTISIIITVCVTFAFAIVLIEIGLQTEKKPLRLIWKVMRSLIRNPLLVAPALGAAASFLGLTIPAPAETFLKMLGGAASPCALVALGLFLAQPRKIERESVNAIAFLVAVKLIVQPLATWLLAVYVFGLPPLLAQSAALLAALPTGTGPFMLAEHYRREATITSNVILYSTVLSILTLSAYLALIR